MSEKQTYRSMLKIREPRNKPTPIWTIKSRQRSKEYTMEKEWSLL